MCFMCFAWPFGVVVVVCVCANLIVYATNRSKDKTDDDLDNWFDNPFL